MRVFIYTMLLSAIADAKGFKLDKNPTFEVPVHCNSLQIEAYCTNEAVHNWCKWNNKLAICQSNYEPILFISPWDIAALSKSMVSMLSLIGCIALYWVSGLLTKKIKIFKGMEKDKKDKCRIYIFELIGTTVAMYILLQVGTFNIIFFPEDYADIDPDDAVDIVRSLAGSVFVMYMYIIEMLTNDLRWGLQLHHVVVIATGVYYMYLLDGSADIASLRCLLSIMLYSYTEHNVFAQLLLYRISPLYSWKIHYLSAIVYIVTRMFGTIAFTYGFISWTLTDAIYNQFHGKEDLDFGYILFFFLMPIITILLNVAQFQTIKALFYVAKSTKKRIKQRNELRKYPRLQILYDMFIEFDSNDNGYWTMMDWKKFIFYHSTFIRHETCIILWNVLGFTNNEISANDSDDSVTGSEKTDMQTIDIEPDTDIVDRRRSTITKRDITGFENKIHIKQQSKKPYMKWKDFRAIFGKHVKNKSLSDRSVKQIISAQLQILLQTIFNAESQFEHLSNVDDKDKTMLQLYRDVNVLIVGDKKKKKEITKKINKMVPLSSLSPETRVSASPAPPSIEMVMNNDNNQPNVQNSQARHGIGNGMKSPSAPDNQNSYDIEIGMKSPSAPDNIQYALSMDNELIVNKQLELDDMIRTNTNRISSIIGVSTDANGLKLKDEKTI